MQRDSEKNEWRIVRYVAGAILLIAFLFMFCINPGVDSDKFSSETLWEAVHPFKFWDFLGLVGLVFFALYVSGLAGKVIYSFTEPKGENESGLVHVVGVVCALLMLLFFV